MIIFGPKLVNFLRFSYDIFISGRSSYSRLPDKRGWGRIKVLRIVPTPGRYQDRLLVFGAKSGLCSTVAHRYATFIIYFETKSYIDFLMKRAHNLIVALFLLTT